MKKSKAKTKWEGGRFAPSLVQQTRVPVQGLSSYQLKLTTRKINKTTEENKKLTLITWVFFNIFGSIFLTFSCSTSLPSLNKLYFFLSLFHRFWNPFLFFFFLFHGLFCILFFSLFSQFQDLSRLFSTFLFSFQNLSLMGMAIPIFIGANLDLKVQIWNLRIE